MVTLITSYTQKVIFTKYYMVHTSIALYHGFILHGLTFIEHRP